MGTRPTPASQLTSSEPILHCCETWRVLAAEGRVIPNRPKQEATWDAIAGMKADLLIPLEREYGVVDLTYGFSGPELVKAIEARAKSGGWLPNITPRTDQHAGHELNTRGKRICERDGIAVDLRVPGHSSEEVAAWVQANLPFDRIYLYDADRPFHLSWAPPGQRKGQVIRMVSYPSGHLVPKVLKRGRTIEP